MHRITFIHTFVIVFSPFLECRLGGYPLGGCGWVDSEPWHKATFGRSIRWALGGYLAGCRLGVCGGCRLSMYLFSIPRL